MSNSVEVVFGRGANEEGVLEIDEGEFCVGRDYDESTGSAPMTQ